MERGDRGQLQVERVYSPVARTLHWLTAAIVAVMIPLGFYMVWRGEVTKFDALTGRLYDVHKSIGFLLLCLVVARLVYRFAHGAPPDEPTLAWWERLAAHATHWGLYAVLLAVPALGWTGISLYGATSLFNVIALPSLTSKDEGAATWIFTLHKYAAILLLAMVGAHIGAALFHHVIRKDGVLRRMLPGLGR